ncbi:hypothetical protein [Schlesneria paludicola]|uniref:hypothetical protein n=1 Tax=Schlesneria paludicola TaxID=360056 RepID=UPI00029A427A|nr:hypothetical protein [Schlesneria paludicola]
MAIESEPLVTSLSRPLIRWISGWNHPIPGREADWSALSEDPEARLSEGAMTFPTLGLRVYAFYFLLLALTWPLTVIYFQNGGMHSLVAAIFGIGAILWYVIGCAVLSRRKLVLDSIGFHIVQGESDTFVPWTSLLINRDWREKGFAWTLPVTSSFHEAAVTTEDGITRTIANGGKLHGMWSITPTQIVLHWTYRLDPNLFREIAMRMAASPFDDTNATRVGPLKERRWINDPSHNIEREMEQLPEGVFILENGALQVPAAALTFPAVCCSCATATRTAKDVTIKTQLYWRLPVLKKGVLTIPTCDDCWMRSRRWFWMTILAIQAIFVVAFVITIFQTLFVPPVIYAVANLAVLLLTCLTYRLMPPIWSVADVTFNPATNEYRFHFSNADYRDQIIRGIRVRDHGV